MTPKTYVPGLVIALLALFVTMPAFAVRWDSDALGGFTVNWHNKISFGVQLRTQSPNTDLIGKASLPQNHDLCANDDCLSVAPKKFGPNNRFLKAPGELAMFSDDGNLNYPNKWDMTAALSKWLSKATFRFGNHGWFSNITFEIGWLAFYDPYNSNFKIRHPNEIVQPGPQPGVAVRKPREHAQIKKLGYNVYLRDANVSFRVPFFGDRELQVKIGRQILNWGEGVLELRGSLNFINPPTFTNLLRPGFALNELYRPVNMITLETNITPNLSAQFFYELGWRPFGIPAKGGLVSFIDVSNDVGPNDAIAAPFGKSPQDPHQLQTPANPVIGLITDTSFSLKRAANVTPSGTGQFGIHLSWLVDSVGANGLNLGFYYAHYNSRLPNASAIAADATCARREGNPQGIDATDLTSFLAACGLNLAGSNGKPGFLDGGMLTQRNALPLDTAKYYLEYPSGIDVFGLSWSTSIGGWLWDGEIAYRPNLPVQVDLVDVLFAAFQPIFPRHTVNIIPPTVTTVGDTAKALSGAVSNVCNGLGNTLGLGGLLGPACDLINSQTLSHTLTNGLLNHGLSLGDAGGATLSNSRRAIPDYLTAYRGGTPGEITPGQHIHGYERLQNITTSFNWTKVLAGDNAPLWADQLALIFDVSTSWVPDLPPLSELQFYGQGTLTHDSPGINDDAPIVGYNQPTDPVATSTVTGFGRTHGPDALRINPVRTTSGYVTKFSMGTRTALLLNYKNFPWPGAKFVPLLAWFHGWYGVSPGIANNFLEGRNIILLDMRVQYRHWQFDVEQVFFSGGGNNNLLSDRDNLNLAVTYKF